MQLSYLSKCILKKIYFYSPHDKKKKFGATIGLYLSYIYKYHSLDFFDSDILVNNKYIDVRKILAYYTNNVISLNIHKNRRIIDNMGRYRSWVIAVSRLQSLTQLNISRNKIDAPGVRAITQMSLTHLDISNNDIDDVMDMTISKMQSLTHLNIEKNRIGINVAKEISKIQSLTQLIIGYNSIYDNGIIEISRMSLTQLSACGIHLTNNGICAISKMKSLTLLNVSDNWIKEEGAKEISKMHNLTQLNISGNYI